MKFKYKNRLNGVFIALLISPLPLVQASIITVNLTGLWAVPSLPNITITADIDSNALDLRSDQVVGKYAVNNFQVYINTEYTKAFHGVTLIANTQNSFIDISQNYLTFYGSFYGSSAHTLSNGDQTSNYQFMAHSPGIIDNGISNLKTLTSINDTSLGYIETQIGAYSSEITNSKISVTSDALTSVPLPAAAWLFCMGSGLLAFNMRSKNISFKV